MRNSEEFEGTIGNLEGLERTSKDFKKVIGAPLMSEHIFQL